MATYCVDWQTGADTNNGTSWATPFRTVDRAFAACGENDFVFISAGHYILRNLIARTAVKSFSPGAITFVGLGGVVIESSAPAAHLRISHGTYRFVNLVFKSNAIRLTYQNEGSTWPLTTISFFNCGLFPGAVYIEPCFTDTPGYQLSQYYPDKYPDFDPNNLRHLRRVGTNFNFYRGTTALDGESFVDAHDVSLPSTSLPITFGGVLVNTSDVTSAGLFPALPLSPQKLQYGASPVFVTPVSTSMEGLFFPFALASNADKNTFNNVWLPDPDGPAATFVFADDDRIAMSSGNNGRVLSPVMFYPLGIKPTRFNTRLFEYQDNNQKQTIDSTPDDIVRTIDYRISDNPFLQTDLLPEWQTIPRDVDLASGDVSAGKYLQLRLTFARNAVL